MSDDELCCGQCGPKGCGDIAPFDQEDGLTVDPDYRDPAIFDPEPVTVKVKDGGTLRETTEEEARQAMRAFDTGATRNVETDPDIYGFTSPLALGLFAEYMHANRTQADGTIRDSDNWKRGIPLDSYIRSMRRHLQDLTLHHDGYGHLAREDIEAALGGLMFNIQGYMHEFVKGAS